MLGIDPREFPEIQEKYVMEMWEAIQNQSEKTQKTEASSPYNVEWHD